MKDAFDIFIRIMYIFDIYVMLGIFFAVVSRGGGFLFWFVVRLSWNLYQLKGSIIEVFITFKNR